LTLQAVFFDLGSTLIYGKESWQDYFHRGDEALLQVLHQAGITVAADTLSHGFPTFIDRYYSQYAPRDANERTAISVLREILAEMGYDNLSLAILNNALQALYKVTNQNWFAEEDAISTLINLHSVGYRLGIISNTSDDSHVQELVDRHGFRQYFEFVLTSAGFGIRKPDPRIFQAALDKFQILPESAAMVGDTLEADILGANQMGIYSIWIKRRSEHQNPMIVPRAAVSALQEIPFLLESLP
jgi:HAD superfamily hydrolase (TIGR01549 family)